MPYPITRIPTDDPAARGARAEALRELVEQRLAEKYHSAYPSLMLDVVVSRRSDYDEVKVFLTEPALMEDARLFLRQLEEELASEGIATLTYVRTWSGPVSKAA